MPPNPVFNKLKIQRITIETPDAKTFVLEPIGWKPVYKVGQFITLVFKTTHGEKRRSYSISSSPELQEPLAITVKKIDNGEFSRQLNYHTKIGDELWTSGIAGFFTLPENQLEYDEFFFIAAGSGIVPCFPIIKTLLAFTEKKVILIYSNKNEKDAIFYKELQALEKKFPERFRVKYLFSVINNIYQSRLSNWLLPQFLDAYMTAPPQKTMFYVCGPFDYMRMVEITLLSRIPKENIIKENFNHWPRLIIPKPPDTAEHKVTVRIRNEVHHLLVKYPEDILDVAKKKNIYLPYSCDTGRCGSCAATCTKGQVWMAYNEVLTDKELEKGRVLVCQAYPIDGDVEIDFDV